MDIGKYLKQPALLSPAIIIAVASLSLAVCLSWTAPLFSQLDLFRYFPFFKNLAGDLAQYFWRFFVYFAFLGLIPLLTLLFLGIDPLQNGLSFPGAKLKWYGWFSLAGAGIGLGALSSFFPDLGTYYPYSKTLIILIKTESLNWLLLHCLIYFFLYYLPWEFFFRGFLLFPFLRIIDNLQPQNRIFKICIISLQTIPSMMLHPGHPFSELLAAIPAGFFFGYLAYKTKSFWPGLVFHACLGISLDFFIIIKSF